MKKKLINYYAVIMIVLYLIYNVTLRHFTISGLLYRGIMYLLIIANAIILVVFKKDIKYKKILCTIGCFTLTVSRNMPQQLFIASNIAFLFFTSSFKSKILGGCGFIAILLLFHLTFFFSYDKYMAESFFRSTIHSDKHYYCENNYEAFVHTNSAYDSYHFSIGIYRDILKIDNVIHIFYSRANGVSHEEYDEFLNTHNCRLVGSLNGNQ